MASFIRAAVAFVLIAALASGQVPTPPTAEPLPPVVGKAPAADGKLPAGVRLRLGSERFREPNYINAANLSPDGKLLAICGGSQQIRFLDVATGVEVRRIG